MHTAQCTVYSKECTTNSGECLFQQCCTDHPSPSVHLCLCHQSYTVISVLVTHHKLVSDTLHCTVYSVLSKLYTVEYILYSVEYVLYTVKCTLETVHCLVHSVECRLYTVYNVLCKLSSVSYPPSNSAV